MTKHRPNSCVDFFETPVLRYIGGKWQLADWILEQFPTHETYVEPYCGAASVFFRKHPSPIEVINDLNGDVVNFFRVLREQAQELIDAIDLTPFSREEYDLAYEEADDPLERARRFYIRSWQSFSGHASYKTGWRHQRNLRTRGSSLTREWGRKDGLYRSALRLRNALIENDDALKVIQRYDTPGTLFYVDPPYVLTTRSNHRRYSYEMSNADHRALAAVLREVQGMVLLSGYQSALYDELFGDWRRIEKTTTTNGNNTATECLWISPNTQHAQAPLLSYIAESRS